MRTFAVALVLASIAVAAPAFAEVPAPVAGSHAIPLVWSPAMIAKVQAQIGLLEGRVAALQPIVVGDTSARDALLADATALEKTAKDDRTQAADFRTLATTAPNPKDLLVFATELEAFATRSEAVAASHRQIAARIDTSITATKNEIAARLALAARLKTALAVNS